MTSTVESGLEDCRAERLGGFKRAVGCSDLGQGKFLLHPDLQGAICNEAKHSAGERFLHAGRACSARRTGCRANLSRQA